MVYVVVNDADETVIDYQSAIRFAGEPLLKLNNIKSEYIQACIDREMDFPTGLSLADGQGVAMPHGDSSFVNEDSISVVRLSNPITFGLMEDKKQKVKVALVFNLALSSGEQHIKVLKKVIALFQDESFMKKSLADSHKNIAREIKERLDSDELRVE
ncbi:PTS sugar transporter subunit IIA [Streptococcus sp. H49]|uniref:PTS sugar transporter subunit IIA n=1 Tax=Streptococcus huangxiaojuni TaxID=3237239 RepID=UPI0034A3BC3F